MSTGTAACCTARSLPLMSGTAASVRRGFSRSAATFTASSTAPTRWSFASATRISWSAVRFTSKRRSAKPTAAKETM